MKHLNVVAAIIKYKDEILCMQRPESKHQYLSLKYEFPGGKIEEGESKEAALERELKEEMALEVTVKSDNFFLTVNHQYPDFSIEMHGFLVFVQNKSFERLEHHHHCWLKVEQLMGLDWAPADLPIVKKLMDR
ncbi:(deoxy)nucleoside triphosphate pyrophosphohydrolase [Eubacteriaceae bacterium ES3]|nr:(deoxy)nucleoside triphosphate pyrophosphohydrolase [Eubacteriaceae bacterium ES3]